MISKTILCGYVVGDPEAKSTKAGAKPITFIKVMTTRTAMSGGEQVDFNETHNVTAFDKLAIIARENFRDGDPIIVEGYNHNNVWKEGGITRQTTEVIAENIRGI